MLYKEALTFEPEEQILTCDIQIKVIEQYFPVVLFVMRCKLVLIIKSEDEILKCGRGLQNWWEMILIVPTFATASETLKCNHSNEIFGVLLLVVFSRSLVVNLRLTNELNFA